MLECMAVCEIEIKPVELFSGLNKTLKVHNLQITEGAVIIPKGCAEQLGRWYPPLRETWLATWLSTIWEGSIKLAQENLVRNSYSLILSLSFILSLLH